MFGLQKEKMITKRDSCIGEVQWTVTVPAEPDESVRRYLDARGDGEDGLSEPVRKAVSGYLISSVARECKEEVRKAALSQQELDKIIEDGIAWAKKQPG